MADVDLSRMSRIVTYLVNDRIYHTCESMILLNRTCVYHMFTIEREQNAMIIVHFQENPLSQSESNKDEEDHHSSAVLCAANEVYAISQVDFVIN
jgi:hypothetical protein